MPTPPSTAWSPWAADSPAHVRPLASLHGLPSLAEAERVCARFTPRVERHAGALVLDLRGCERLLLGGGFPTTWADVLETTEDLEWPALAGALSRRFCRELPDATTALRIGIGPTRTVAWLAATVTDPLQRPWRALPPSGVATFLSPLPLNVLRTAPDLARWSEVESTCAALEEAGVRRVEQLVRMPALALERRFGAAGAALLQVATGRDLLPFLAIVPETWLGARLRFPAGVDAEHLGATLAPLAERLAKTLADQQLTACAAALTLTPEHGSPLRTLRHLQHPIASADALLAHAWHLFFLLVTPPAVGVLAASDPRSLPGRDERYVAIRLRVGALGPETLDQSPLWSDERLSTSRLRRARLLAVLYAQQTRADWHRHVPLLRAVAHDPDAVLPEERYRLAPWEVP
jgi:hypothetical protein